MSLMRIIILLAVVVQGLAIEPVTDISLYPNT